MTANKLEETLIQAVKIYQDHGAVRAILFLKSHGMSTDEAVELLAKIDDALDKLKSGG